MNVRFLCPHCQFPGRLLLRAATEWTCPGCARQQSVAAADPQLASCPLCGCPELFRKKNFPQWLGMTILLAAFVLFVYLHFWYEKWLAWGVLLGSALVDTALFLAVGDVVTCYRCQAEYRGLPRPAGFKPFDLAVAERHRQEKLRRQQWKIP